MNSRKSMPAIRRFANRREAGNLLANELTALRDTRDLVIFALPRGGVPIAAEITAALDRPLHVLVLRKLGVPGHEEVAMGAIAPGGICILSQELIDTLGISKSQINAVIDRESAEVSRREMRYGHGRPIPDVAGRTVLVVDDGAATGSTMSAAVALLRHLRARHIVVAVPVAPIDTVERLREEADEVVALKIPHSFHSVGEFYEDFSQTSDQEVESLLTAFTDSSKPELHEACASSADSKTLDSLRKHVVALTGGADDYDGLLQMIGDASLVLLGEASHGTHEFYRERALITQRLIREKGFNAVAVEADWPDACRVNRYVQRTSTDATGSDALEGFERFPSWMWRNADVLDFIGWLADHNENHADHQHRVGFYGLDLYSIYKSIGEVVAYLEMRDPVEAAKAKNLYGCMDRYGHDPQLYGMMVMRGLSKSCRSELMQQLVDLRCKEAQLLAWDGKSAADEYFFATQNARLVRNAEQYYRTMFHSEVSSWNLRDQHMMETLIELLAYLQSRHGSSKVVVWAHNSHLGDARATEMGRRGEWNLGQLVRQEFGHLSRLIGFSTYGGTVTAASGWHLPAERKQVRPGTPGSFEQLFHQVGTPNFWIDLTRDNSAVQALKKARLERAIGVVYRPETELRSHYFMARLSRQFDALIHFDQTRAVEPMDRHASWEDGEIPETYPAGL